MARKVTSFMLLMALICSIQINANETYITGNTWTTGTVFYSSATYYIKYW